LSHTPKMTLPREIPTEIQADTPLEHDQKGAQP
jgi:hypothetical protein